MQRATAACSAGCPVPRTCWLRLCRPPLPPTRASHTRGMRCGEVRLVWREPAVCIAGWLAGRLAGFYLILSTCMQVCRLPCLVISVQATGVSNRCINTDSYSSVCGAACMYITVLFVVVCACVFTRLGSGQDQAGRSFAAEAVTVVHCKLGVRLHRPAPLRLCDD